MKSLLVAHSHLAGTDYESTGIFRFRDMSRYSLGELSDLELTDVRSSASDIVELYDSIVARILDQTGKPRFCDKLTIRKWRLRFVQRHFPKGRFVHIVRDCRDGYCSALGHPNVPQSSSPRRWARYWRMCVASPEQVLDPDRLHTVAYETLVTQPRETVAELMDWLGLPFEPHQVDSAAYAATTSVRKRDTHENLNRPINRDSIQRWQEELTPEVIRVLERYAGRELVRRGYALAGTA